MERYTLTAGEAALRIGIGKSKCLEMLQKGELPGMRIGRNWLISERALEEWCYGRSIHEAGERSRANAR